MGLFIWIYTCSRRDFKGNIHPAGKARKNGQVGCNFADGIDFHGKIGVNRRGIEYGGCIVCGTVGDVTVSKVELSLSRCGNLLISPDRRNSSWKWPGCPPDG